MFHSRLSSYQALFLGSVLIWWASVEVLLWDRYCQSREMINGMGILDPEGCTSHSLASFLLKGHVFNHQLHKQSFLCDFLAFHWVPPAFDPFNKKILFIMAFTTFVRSLRMKYSGKHNQAVLTKLERNALERERERDIKKLQSGDECQGEWVSGHSKAKQRKIRKKKRNQLPISSYY